MQPGMLSAAHWHISLEWTEEEQRTLEEHLQRFPPERYDALQRYVKLASILPRHNVRDVALRCKWTVQQQLIKKRKMAEGGNGPMGMLPKKPGGPSAGPAKPPLMPVPLPVSNVGVHMSGSMPPPFLPPGAQPVQHGGSTAGTAAAGGDAGGGGLIVDGPIAQLLENNYGILNTFRANMSAFKVAENTQLLMQFRDNILAIISHMESMGGVMDQMPQLPVRLNVDLANNFLPSRSTFPSAPPYASGGGGSLPPQPAVNIPGMVPLNGFAPGSNTPPPTSVPQPHAPAASAAMPSMLPPPIPTSMPAAAPSMAHAVPPGMPAMAPSAAAGAAAVPGSEATAGSHAAAANMAHGLPAASQPLPMGRFPMGPAVPAVHVKQEPSAAQPMGPASRSATPVPVPGPIPLAHAPAAAAPSAAAATAAAGAGAPAAPAGGQATGAPPGAGPPVAAHDGMQHGSGAGPPSGPPGGPGKA